MHGFTDVSPWVKHCIARLAQSKPLKALSALDLACGAGRHANFLASTGMRVHAIDRQTPPSGSLSDGVKFELLDLEADSWPLAGRRYDIVVVTNYLYRPRFSEVVALLAPGGVLIYETFMQGNEVYGSPRRPEFLLNAGELLTLVQPCQILGFEQGERDTENPAVVQRVFAISGQWSEIQSSSKLFMRRD